RLLAQPAPAPLEPARPLPQAGPERLLRARRRAHPPAARRRAPARRLRGAGALVSTLALPAGERRRLERRALLLAWGGNAYHLLEFAVALGAGIAAGSIALIGFGADSLIEVFSGGVIAWLFSGGRGASEDAERRARRLIAVSYFVLVAYILAESLHDLIGGHHPQPS